MLPPTSRYVTIAIASIVLSVRSLQAQADPPKPEALAREVAAAEVGDFLHKLCDVLAEHGMSMSSVAPWLSPSRIVETEYYSELLFEKRAVNSIRFAKDAAAAGPAAIQCRVAWRRSARIYGTPWPREPMLVDLVGEAGATGAYSTVDPPHLVIAAEETRNQCERGLEALFHEASHELVDPLSAQLERRFQAHGKQAMIRRMPSSSASIEVIGSGTPG
jgi:hypothetical protein